MALGWTDPLLLFAFDHRDSLERRLGVPAHGTDEQQRRVRYAKQIVFDGFRNGLQRLDDHEGAAILVDEQYGAELVPQARALGALVAMPVERSGQESFSLEYGDTFAAHVEKYDPDFVKVLVRYNPGGNNAMNNRQNEVLAQLSQWCEDQHRRFLLEYLLPPTAAQLESVGGSRDRFDNEIRPELMVSVIEEMYAAGVEPAVWKVEGLDQREHNASISAAVRSGGRDHVSCVVLGRGADLTKVEQWLRAGAGVPGYVGFAIGRSLWSGALDDVNSGAVTRDQAVSRIGGSYARVVNVWRDALPSEAS